VLCALPAHLVQLNVVLLIDTQVCPRKLHKACLVVYKLVSLWVSLSPDNSNDSILADKRCIQSSIPRMLVVLEPVSVIIICIVDGSLGAQRSACILSLIESKSKVNRDECHEPVCQEL
jgi:hypothetical protein